MNSDRHSPENFQRRKFLKQCGLGIGVLSLAGTVVARPDPKESDPVRLRAGASRRRVTPPIWVPYLTSSALGTNAEFKAVHDDLWARALVLDDGKNAIAVLTVDSIGYDNTVLGQHRHFTRELRKKVSSKTGLRPNSIMLTATHTHSAPETIGLTPFCDVARVREWLETHLLELSETVIEAWKQRVPVQARFGTRKVEGIARNRRILLKSGKLSVHGPLPTTEQIAIPPVMDEDLAVLSLERLDGSTHSVLFNYTAHPVVAMVLPEVCADYPGAAVALMESRLEGAVCLFCNGAAGNINSVKVSTNYEDVAMLGQKLGHAALQEVEELKKQAPLSDTAIRCHSEEIILKARPCPSVDAAQKLVAADPSQTNKAILRMARKLKEEPLRAELQAMSVGPVKWISLPGEPFVETGVALKTAGASFVVGYANGWLGYFPIERAYGEGGYEVGVGTWSRVASGSAERLETAGAVVLSKLKKGSV